MPGQGIWILIFQQPEILEQGVAWSHVGPGLSRRGKKQEGSSGGCWNHPRKDMWTNLRDVSAGEPTVYSDELHTKNEWEGDLRINASRFSNLRELANVMPLTKMETEGRISLNYLLVSLSLEFLWAIQVENYSSQLDPKRDAWESIVVVRMIKIGFVIVYKMRRKLICYSCFLKNLNEEYCASNFYQTKIFMQANF